MPLSPKFRDEMPSDEATRSAHESCFHEKSVDFDRSRVCCKGFLQGWKDGAQAKMFGRRAHSHA